MAVIVNDFEIAPAETAPTRGSESESTTNAPEPEKPKEHEVAKMMARYAERCERIWAH